MSIKYLASGGSLPYTKDDGKPDHRLMGAAWAALFSPGGFRGKKYSGTDKAAAKSKLRGLYKSEGLDTPQESASDWRGPMLVESGLSKNDSFDSIRSAVQCAIQSNIGKGIDMDGDDDGPQDMGDYAWVVDMYPSCAVYSQNGKLMQVDYSIGDDGTVDLGDPIAVEMSYTPVDESDRSRAMVSESQPIAENAYDSTTGQLTLTVIKPGFNKSGERYYPAAVLKRDHQIFEGAKMFADHQTEAESKNRPEGSVNHWVASIKKVWVESDGTVKATAVAIDPPFKAKLEELAKQGMLKDMGVSIRAVGESSRAEIQGRKTNMVESLVRARSVDFVTYAGAGGQVEAIEADRNDELDVDLVTEAQLRERRPDLVTLIESHPQEGMLKTLEQQLQEANTQLAGLTTENAALKTKIEESDKAKKIAEASVELNKQLAESKLPDAAQARLREQFKEAVSSEKFADAIKAEKAYISTLSAGGVRNMGVKENGKETEGASKDETRTRLVESFISLGLPKEQAEVAANVK